MKIDKYLVIKGKKGRYSYSGVSAQVRLVEREPSLAGDEVAVRLVIDIPDAFFKRPTLTAELAIPSEAVPQTKLTPEVTDNVEKLIKEGTGLDMKVSIVPYKDEEPQQ